MSVVWILLRLAAALLLFRLLGLPLARLAFPRLPATAYATATTVGLVLSAHATWLFCHAGMRLGAASIGLGLLATAAASFAASWRVGSGATARIARPRAALVHHLVFALAFALALAITARNPAVDPDSERFMDLAMVRAVEVSRSLPLEDPWLAGERVSYYDYGYFATAYLAIFAGDLDFFFNIAVALIFPALLAGALALGLDLAGPWGAFLAAWLVSLAGNMEALRQTAVAGLRAPLDWFRAARVLEGGITEFPLFTLLWGDLHPYALALPLWPLLLAVAASFLQGQAPGAAVGIGATALAALSATNTWDAFPVAALLVLAGVAARRREGSFEIGWQALLTISIAILLALPFLLHAPVGGRGLARVPTPSLMTELLLAWGAPAAILLVALLHELGRGALGRSRAVALASFGAAVAVLLTPSAGIALAGGLALAALTLALRSESQDPFAWAAVAVGAGLVCGVELLYVDDWYSGELERMNTVFKAYVEAWILIAFGAALLLARMLRTSRLGGGLLAAAVLLTTALYPVRGIHARAFSRPVPFSLDVWESFRSLDPDGAAAARQLRAFGRGVVLEATGGPYSWHGRFATFTGFPAVVGWGHHEMGWRNVTAPIQERIDAIQEVYRGASLEPLRELQRRHRVRWLVVGQLERKEYPEDALAKFATLEVAIRSGSTVIYDLGAGQ